MQIISVVDPVKGLIGNYAAACAAAQVWVKGEGRWMFSSPDQLRSETKPTALRELLICIQDEPVPEDNSELYQFAVTFFKNALPTRASRRTQMPKDEKVTKARPTFKGEIGKADIIQLPSEDTAPARRPGSKVAKIFAAYKNGQTVADWLEAVKPLGGGLANLKKDLAFGRVELKKAA